MAQPFQEPRLDMYAQDLLRRSYQDSQIDPQILMQFGQGMPRQTFEPPAPPAPQAQQYLQPSPQRMEYANLVEQRFQEIANMVGGMDMLVKTGRIDKARQAAMEDVAMLYGEAPAIEKPIRVESVEGINFAIGPTGQPMQLPTEMERQAQELALRKAQAELTQAEQKASTEASKTKQESSSAATGLGLSVKIFDNALSLAKEMRDSPALPETVGGGDPLSMTTKAYKRNIQGTPEYNFATNAQRLKSTAFAQAITMLKGMGALSNAEGTAITNALTDVDNLGQSPEQYQKRLDEFISLMDSLVTSKKKELSSYQAPKIDLENFDIRNVPISNQQEQTQTAAPAEPMKVQSPGAVKVVRDPTTGRLIRQQ